METLHRILSNGNQAFKDFLDREGIDHQYDESGVGKKCFLLIAESDPKWPGLEGCLSQHDDVFHTVEIRFSKKEVMEAEWCALGVTSHFGYPQPENAFQRATYEPGTVCKLCGRGGIQIKPFRFRNTPTQRHSHLLQLNWVMDEFFVSTQARVQMEEAAISGVRFLAPVLHKSDLEMPGWFQMQVVHTLSGVMRPTSHVCRSCNKVGEPYRGRSRLVVHTSSAPSVDVAKTHEWFGGGPGVAAFRAVLVSKRFVSMITTNGWRGVHLEPLELIVNRTGTDSFAV